MGYLMLVLPAGVLLSIALVKFEPEAVYRSAGAAAMVTLTMICLAMLFPKAFLESEKIFLCSLAAVAVVEIYSIAVRLVLPGFWNTIVITVICTWIGFDWSEAQKQTRTVNHAIRSVAHLYLDILNLFLRLLLRDKGRLKK